MCLYMVYWGCILSTFGLHREVVSFKPAFSLVLPRWSLSVFFLGPVLPERNLVSCIWNLRLTASILGAKQQKAARVLFIIFFQCHLFPLLPPCLVSRASASVSLHNGPPWGGGGRLEWLRRLANSSLPKTSENETKLSVAPLYLLGGVLPNS